MNAKIKKIIAREGLLIITLGIFSVFEEIRLAKKWAGYPEFYKDFKYVSFEFAGIIYCAYLLIRFIIWAVKTLKQKSVVI